MAAPHEFGTLLGLSHQVFSAEPAEHLAPDGYGRLSTDRWAPVRSPGSGRSEQWQASSTTT
jgi:hypothetical protein